MRDFMRDDALDTGRDAEMRAHLVSVSAARIENIAGEYDGAGVLHATELRGANDQRQLFIRIRRDRFVEKSECRCSACKPFGRVVLIVSRDIEHEIRY